MIILLPSRTITLDSSGSAYVPFVSIRISLISISNPFEGDFQVNLGAGNQIVSANGYREFLGSDLTNFSGYLEISNGLPLGSLEVFYEFAPQRGIISKIFNSSSRFRSF